MNEDEIFQLSQKIRDVLETEGDIVYIITSLYDYYVEKYGGVPLENFTLEYHEEYYCHQCGAKLKGD